MSKRFQFNCDQRTKRRINLLNNYILMLIASYIFIWHRLFYYLYKMKGKNSIVLSKIKAIISQIDPQAEVILYGSRARGDEHPDSDWDLLILVNSQTDLNYEMIFRHKLFDLELELEQSFSVNVYNKNEWKLQHWMTPLYQNIVRDGIRI